METGLGSPRRPWRDSSHVGQISPDKDVNCGYSTAAFTLSPESGASSSRAGLPGDWALYATSVRRLTALPEASSGRSLTVPPLPSASIWAYDSNTLTGFTHRGLTPHKFTPVPGVHKELQPTPQSVGDSRCSGKKSSSARLSPAVMPKEI